MSITPIQITSMNMRHRNPLFFTFLQDTKADLVLVQEPWFGCINVLCSDTDPDGMEVLGATKHADWDFLLPKHSGTDVCKVACYICHSFASSPTVSIVQAVDHELASLTTQVLEVAIEGMIFCIVNIYHCIPKRGHVLHSLFNHPLDTTIPTYITGDFNTHSSTWSLPGATVSSWAAPLEEWFEDSDLTLISPARQATWKGNPKKCERDSVLDLSLLNESALASGRF